MKNRSCRRGSNDCIPSEMWWNSTLATARGHSPSRNHGLVNLSRLHQAKFLDRRLATLCKPRCLTNRRPSRQRQGKSERRAPTLARRYPDMSALYLNKTLADGEPQAQPQGFTRGVRGAIERLENSLDLVISNARP